MKLTHVLGLLASLVLSAPVIAEVQSRSLSYQLGGQNFHAYVAYDDRFSGPRPGVLVVHEWWGLNDYARRRAEMLAEQGYVALALDMYGDGKHSGHPDDANGFMMAVLNNITAAEQRFRAAKQLLQQQPEVNPEQLAAIGYCFGGGIVLHMARQGEELAAVASFHGTLASQPDTKPGKPVAKVLAFNGAADPFVPPEQVAAFEQDMQSRGADYELHNYAGVLHSFTNPGADAVAKRYELPVAYDQQADEDSWKKTLAVFKSLFN